MSSLDNLRKTAKRWLKAIRSGDADAVARFRRLYPSGPAAPGLRDVQHALALERGAASWATLKRGLVDTTIDSSEEALTALLQAAHAGDAARVAEIADAYPQIVSTRGALRGHRISPITRNFLWFRFWFRFGSVSVSVSEGRYRPSAAGV